MMLSVALPGGSVALPEEELDFDRLDLEFPPSAGDPELLERIEELRPPDAPPSAPGVPSRGARLIIVANVVAAALYAGWWALGGAVGSPILFALLGAAEGFSLVHITGFWWTAWSADTRSIPVRVPTFTVDAFVTTCGEPIDVVAATLEAVIAMRGEHRTVLLDDAARDEMRELAERLGAGYLARGTRRGAKAGNLNHGLENTGGEVIASFDADHRPRPDFLERTLPYLADPELGLVQTPQFYADSRNSELGRSMYLQQAVFFGPICRGKSGVGAMFCCGTGYVARRRALEDAGGYHEESVVEDVVTSMRMQRKGWRSAYYPYVVVEGLGPRTLQRYFRQQFRWARGTIGALVAREPFGRGFSWRQRLQYLLGTTYYLTGLATLVYVSLPILYDAGGWTAFSPGSGSFIFFFAPYMFLALVTARLALGKQLRVEHLRYTFGAFPVYAAASVAALLGLRTRFSVTGGERPHDRVPRLAWVTVVAFALSGAAIVSSPFLRGANALTFTHMTWAAVNMTLMSGIVAAVLREGAPRAWARLQRIADAVRGAPLVPSPHLDGNGNGNGNGRLRADYVLPELAVPALPARPAPAEVRHPRRPLLWILAVAFAVRVAVVPLQGIRLDEGQSWHQASAPFSEMVKHLATWDIHPPLFDTVLHFTMRLFGDSLWALRAPSIIAGTISVALLYAVASRLVSRRAALCAAGLAAVCPFLVWHQSEARAYAILLAFELASVLLLMNALERGRAWRWAAYSLATAACLYTHYLGALALVIHVLYLAFVPRGERRRIVPFVLSLGLVVALVTPWVYFVHTQGASAAVSSLSNGAVLPNGPHGIFPVIASLLAFGSVLVMGYQPDPAPGLVASIAIGIWPAIPVALVLSRKLGGWLRRRTSLLLLAWAVTPVLALFAASQSKPEIWLYRYAMAATPALLILGGVVCARLIRSHRAALILPIVAFAALTLHNQLDPRNIMREDFRGAADVIESNSVPADGVLVGPDFATQPASYVLHRRLEPIPRPAGGVPAELAPTLRRYAGHYVWYLSIYPKALDAHRIVPRYLRANLRPVSRRSFGPNLELTRYFVPSGFGSAVRKAPTAPGGPRRSP